MPFYKGFFVNQVKQLDGLHIKRSEKIKKIQNILNIGLKFCRICNIIKYGKIRAYSQNWRL